MPCTDITEIATIWLDEQDRLRHYMLRKRSCNRPVDSQSLPRQRLIGRSAEEIASDGREALMHGLDLPETEAFLSYKHLCVLQAVLQAYLGHVPSGAASECAIAEITCDEHGVVIEARVRLSVKTEDIQPCKSHSRCGCH